LALLEKSLNIYFNSSIVISNSFPSNLRYPKLPVPMVYSSSPKPNDYLSDSKSGAFSSKPKGP
jgi:hypothetical protein